ncbi:FAD-dependent monooxygenase [Streptomyces solicathayae]|uniref:FAD-dependent monooxygenase n=1 Tax=Streptomyces solicathayae TaxID=3081768 RepID=A0ABZ0M1L1_9ACTN|nr:FAD-dependent monooxygenase [Streptomyces sp. HUAS YS2]WOX25644.1 FAD-dependent monooxygenase [Streptomyces sp. HUAS YS2]
MQQHAVVIGGGIGGLTTAVALHQQGRPVTVLERAASLAPVGAGIGLAPNSQRALDVIGLGDRVRELAAWQGDGGMRTPSGRWLVRLDAAAVAARFGGALVLLHRAALVDLLVSALPEGTVRTGVTASVADPGDDERPAVVALGDGETIEAGLVVAADGIHSAVRRGLFPDHPGPEYSGFTTWRVVVPAPDRPFAPHETWGRGRLWGTQPLKDGRIYAYAMAVAPAGDRAPDDERAELLRHFGDWHDPIPAILAATSPEGVLRHDVHHLITPLPAFHRGRVALLGDAAHAMEPTLAQGGNQAIEDGIVLAHHAAGRLPPSRALAGYTADRLPRTTDIVRKAARAGRLTTMSSRPGVAVRDVLVAAVSRFGPGLVLRGFDGIADWSPPGATYAADRRDLREQRELRGPQDLRGHDVTK